MTNKNYLLLLLLALAGSLQAVSFRDYYNGNQALGIPSHKDEIDKAMASGVLDLAGRNITSLDGLTEIVGHFATSTTAHLQINIDLQIAKNLVRSQATSAPEENNELTELSQVANLEHANANFPPELRDTLFEAIKNGDAKTMRQLIDEIKSKKVSGPHGEMLDVSKIIKPGTGDANLLNMLVTEAGHKIDAKAKEIRSLNQNWQLGQAQPKTLNGLREELNTITRKYLDLLNALRECGDECIYKMLRARDVLGFNIQDMLVSQIKHIKKPYFFMLYGFGPGNELYQTLESLVASIPESEKTEKEKVAWAKRRELSFWDYYSKNRPEVDRQITTGSLNLSNRNLTSIDGLDKLNVEGVDRLKKLDLSNNLIAKIGPRIMDLSELEELNLSHNHLNSLPDDIGKLIKLKNLLLAYNRFEELPAAVINKLPALQWLYITGNPLSLDENQLREELQLPARVQIILKAK